MTRSAAASNPGRLACAQNQGVTLTACAAQRGNAVPGAAPGELERGMQRDPGARHPDRVTDRDGARR